MKFHYKKINAAMFFLSVFIITCSNISENKNYYGDSKEGNAISDSAELIFQNTIDSTYETIFSFNQLIYVQNRLTDSIQYFKELQSLNSDSINNSKSKLISKIQGYGNSKIKESLTELELWVQKNTQWEVSNIKSKKSEENLTDSLKNLEPLIKERQHSFDSIIKIVDQRRDTLLGKKSFNVKKNKVEAFIAKKGIHDIHISVNKGPFSFESFNKYLIDNKIGGDILMITNGGMYMPDFAAQGLLVSNSKKINELDTTQNKSGNFYIQPNGVFFIDTLGNFKVKQTKDYLLEYQNKKGLPKYATQSGPMLVVNGKMNPRLSLNSENFNIRSGVGEMPNGKVVFIISSGKINFYDFALIFKDYFGCKNALYLDGAISEMYFKGEEHEPNGNFGPMIGVMTKK